MGGLAEIGQEIERAGLDACWVTDHPFPVPDATGRGHPALDPFVLLGYIASATSQLLLHMNALILPYRNPFLAAKAVATLDHLSGGRVLLGVGAGYLREEFAGLGVDYAERHELVDEAIAGLKIAWTGEEVKAGDAIKIIGNPSRDGTNVVHWQRLVLADGKQLWGEDVPEDSALEALRQRRR